MTKEIKKKKRGNLRAKKDCVSGGNRGQKRAKKAFVFWGKRKKNLPTSETKGRHTVRNAIGEKLKKVGEVKTKRKQY